MPTNIANVASEGQADYWGNSKCLRRYFDYLGNSESVIVKFPVNQYAKTECAKIWTDKKDNAICQRVMITAEQKGKLSADLHNIVAPQLSLSETTFDNIDADGYPTVQCRQDTAREAALCEIAYDVDVDSFYAKYMKPSEKYYQDDKGQCASYKKRGARPRCWYKPSWLTEKLVQAILDQNPDEVRFYLISLRADPNRQSSNSNGKWALELANQSGNIEIINLLKANGAKLPTTWW
jgi:hypothetical protein